MLGTVLGFPGGSDVKVSARNVGDPSSIPGSGRSPGEVNGNPLHYSCLENSMDGGARWAVGAMDCSPWGCKELDTTFHRHCFRPLENNDEQISQTSLPWV